MHGHFSGTSDNICWLAPEVLAQDTGGYSLLSDVYRYIVCYTVYYVHVHWIVVLY